MKIKIGVDLDDTLCDFVSSLILFCKEERNVNFRREDFGEYDLRRILSLKGLRADLTLSDFCRSSYFINMPVMPYAVEGVKELVNANYDPVVVSARSPLLFSQTKCFLDRSFPDVSECFLLGDIIDSSITISKGQFCLENNIKALVDDGPLNATSCFTCNIPIVLIAHPWNEFLRDNSNKLVKYVYSWQKVPQSIKELLA